MFNRPDGTELSSKLGYSTMAISFGHRNIYLGKYGFPYQQAKDENDLFFHLVFGQLALQEDSSQKD